MGARGPLPSGARSRPNDQRRDEARIVEVAADDTVRGPELPEDFEDAEGRGWPASTVRWWETWRRSPQAVTFIETDWESLREAAVLHAAFWRGDIRVAGELRQRLAAFGATPADRLRLRLSVKDPAAVGPRPEARAAAAAASSASSRRSRILKAVAADGVVESAG